MVNPNCRETETGFKLDTICTNVYTCMCSRAFSVSFEVFRNVIKHNLECLIYLFKSKLK